MASTRGAYTWGPKGGIKKLGQNDAGFSTIPAARERKGKGPKEKSGEIEEMRGVILSYSWIAARVWVSVDNPYQTEGKGTNHGATTKISGQY